MSYGYAIHLIYFYIKKYNLNEKISTSYQKYNHITSKKNRKSPEIYTLNQNIYTIYIKLI